MYVASYDRNMYALDVKNRRESWRFKAGWIIGTDPVIDGNIVYFGSWDQNMYAVDITTGREVWKFRAENIIDDLKPLIHDGIIYFGSVDSNMYAVSAGEGKLLWKFRTGGDIWSDAVHWNGLVIFGSWDCHLYAVDAKTGKEAWRFQTSTRTQSPLEMAEQIIVEPRFREKTGSGGKQGDYGPHPDIDLSETVYSIRSEYSGREVYGAGKKDYKAV
jgi:outer membrane protein assembly factor BamB